MDTSQTYTLLLTVSFALAAGLVGCFALMKRMLLASDVLSHLALPGLGLAFLFKLNPLAGGAATLLLGTLLVWQLQKKTGLAADASIGVVFAVALALGAALTPSEDLVEALFGTFPKLSLFGFLVGLAAVAAVILAILAFKNRLTLAVFSPELAAATGLNVNRLELYYLLVFSVTIIIGLRFMGALLSSALIIMPAATARQVTNGLSRFIVVSMAVSSVSVLAGSLINAFVVRSSTAAPAIVVVSALCFGLSLLKKAG
ncbi:MAG TPA: metal ABC transporter permease [Candidatus Acidoferrales bacterium]|nr:metal ABC transporter permease [Candidatus Acidoferrales bacterium]